MKGFEIPICVVLQKSVRKRCNMHAHEGCGCYSQYSMIFINKTYALTSAQLFNTSLFTEILSCHRNGDLKSPNLKLFFSVETCVERLQQRSKTEAEGLIVLQ